MAQNARRFADLLTQAIRTIAARENKTIKYVQDQLGYAIGRDSGGSAIEYWRRGNIPLRLIEVEKLARELVAQHVFDVVQLETFLRSADYGPTLKLLLAELFPDSAQPQAQPAFQRELSPFVVGPAISEPKQFFGREAELSRIFQLWRQFPLQNVAIVGLHRSGKTSLLHYLKNITTTDAEQLRPGQRSDWLPQADYYRWIFVDFQDVRMRHLEPLLRYLLSELQLTIPERCDMITFMDAVSYQLEKPTIILMDEIGAGLAAPELDLEFWWSLRSLGSSLSHGNLAFALSANELPSQLAREAGKPSPFFNIFGHTLTLGPLLEPEARELISASPISFQSADVDWLLQQSKGWPNLLQMLCQHRLNTFNKKAGDQTWREEGLKQLSHYQYLLDT